MQNGQKFESVLWQMEITVNMSMTEYAYSTNNQCFADFWNGGANVLIWVLLYWVGKLFVVQNFEVPDALRVVCNFG